MPKHTLSALDCLLATAAERAEQARIEAEAEAARQAAAARKEAKRVDKANQAEAIQATDNVFAAIADATGVAKSVGDYPAVTVLMNSLAASITGGAVPVPPANQPANAPAPQTSGGDESQPAPATNTEVEELHARLGAANEQLDTSNQTAVRLQSQVEASEANLTTATAEKERLEGELTTANLENERLQGELTTANGQVSDLQGQLNTANAALEPVQTELAEAQATIDSYREQVAAMPAINTHKRTLTGKVAVPLADANKLNEGRKSMRELLGLDNDPESVSIMDDADSE